MLWVAFFLFPCLDRKEKLAKVNEDVFFHTTINPNEEKNTKYQEQKDKGKGSLWNLDWERKMSAAHRWLGDHALTTG